MITEAIRTIVEGRDLSAQDVQEAMQSILLGEATEAQIAAFAVGLRMKGETAEEIAGAARAMREHCSAISPDVQGPLVDTCGTGGDGLETFNISTASAIVVAACGVSVAKHGNRAVSSKSGSADVLETLGLRIDLEPQQAQRCIEEVGIGFLFAPAHHGAMKHAAPVRRQLGLRTFFNLLGPLSNPAGATHQLVGVYDEARIAQLAAALGALGLRQAWVVHGHGGMDEVSPAGRTTVAHWDGGAVRTFELMPSDFGVEPVRMADLVGGDAVENARIIRAVLDKAPGAPRTAVLVNAGAVLCVAEAASNPAEGAAMAAQAIDSGGAREKLDQWIQLAQAL